MSEKFNREKGIQAIIELQEIVGIVEPREKAERGWDKFSINEKKQTMLAHSICCKRKIKQPNLRKEKE